MSKANNRGRYYENKSKDLLISQGWIVEKAMPKVVWIHGKPISMHHDFFGLFDLMAVKDGITKYIQVKFVGEDTSIPHLLELKQKITDFPAEIKELWIWRKDGHKVNLEAEIL